MRNRFVGILCALLGLAALGVAGCGIINIGTQGSGHVKTESRLVSGFSRVSLSGIGTLTIQQTGTESLSITTDDNILPLIETKVSGDTLSIGAKSGESIGQVTRLDYALTVKSLRGLDISGAGTVNVMSLTTDSLEVTLSGATTATVSGQARSQTVQVNGAGSYEARDFATKTATISISGAGSASVSVSDTLDATISGAGSVTYYGSPHVTQHISGAGSIKQG